ncbi:CmcI family methyltransferase [Algoriphagus aquimarinus]|uniref:CmcI family methyltransferase n=1 Tax=Algoriphagus aquimarinus TaxID=237018 RepID=UPI0030D8A02D|tara:strand:- start:2193 stop:2825 length:633 start_codon:yes stop_codon:yes gene_type:complete
MNFRFKREKSYSLSGINEGHHSVTYRGVKSVKCPFDYVIYQMIINEVKPDLIIEIGTKYGGSAFYYADLLSLIGHGEIHTIDILNDCEDIVKNHSRVSSFTGGWENYDLSNTKGYDKILVIEDSSHTYENTLAAINKFWHLVSLDSYLIVEDGIINALGRSEEFNGGPVKAIEEFLKVNVDFKLDYKWLNFFGKNATFNTKGYLKRISNG